MYRAERDGEPSPPRSRSSSRRNSASLSRRSSLKKDKEVKNTFSSTPSSATSTPKRTVRAQNLELLVTGKQLLKRYLHHQPTAKHKPLLKKVVLVYHTTVFRRIYEVCVKISLPFAVLLSCSTLH